MKVENSRAAVRRYEMERSPNGRVDGPWVSENCGPIHAVLLEDPRGIRQYKLNNLRRDLARQHAIQFIFDRWDAPYTMCGIQVRVVYPLSFDTDEDGACPECKSLGILRAMDPEEYLRQAKLIEQRELRADQLRRRKRREREERQRFLEELDIATGERSETVGGIQVDPDNPDHWVFPDLKRNEDLGSESAS